MSNPADPSTRPPLVVGRMALAGTLAVVMAAVAAGVTMMNLTPAGAGVGVSGRATATEARAADSLKVIVLASPDGTLKNAPARFEWQALDGATAYELKLYADDATVLWASPQGTATAVDRPPTIVLPTGQQYHWQVRAFANGKVVGESRLATFEII